MRSRMRDPAAVLPAAAGLLAGLDEAARAAGVAPLTVELVRLRVSQINGSGACVEAAARAARVAGASEEALATVAVWRQSRAFDGAERAALALAEAATRLADRPDAVTDDTWDAAATHFDEWRLAGLLLTVGVTNLRNRLNAATRQGAGAAR
ncbi:carboxymuconolactone decarboxylase family protein [Streptomyces sp. 3MP-14]|uniref:Carboxymuconolactone decarboxylase family protein n=1 Tax=Streptomyces mimosae TaxID=2586635 RepID=A0A5N6A0I2_9ACTN|nr:MULTISPECIES: carboxymuconolactone decarboxylase family protein [Streptomyces]KAB8162035.1 carboxymuconolactone decarboxylase family protein [Streptomyces mimosae]KAB8173732.1 carboxymuconolactone decarboxylase family protein [Streptomyces sp. 3MP-14]